MVKCGRDGDKAVQTAPTPTFSSLPDVAHSSIATFLPDGNGVGKDSRLRVAEASRALLESYGGNLNLISVHYAKDASAGRLAALLRRQKKLGEIVVSQQEALPALSQAIAQGCCRGVDAIDLQEAGNAQVMPERIDLLAGALEVDEALPSLQSLVSSFPATPGAAVSKLVRALRGGSSPLLERFDVRFAGLTAETGRYVGSACAHSWLP